MTETLFDIEKYRPWIGREVVVVANAEKSDGTKLAVEIRGELRAVHVEGIMIRPKGRTTPEMVSTSEIEKFDLYDELPKPISSKRLADVAFGSIRQHLADRHGVSLNDLNAPDFTEAHAYDFHLDDHSETAEPISHFHE